MTDRHDDAARDIRLLVTDWVNNPYDQGSAWMDGKIAALLRETERKAVRRCEEIEAIRCFGSNAPSAIRAEYPEHFEEGDDDAR